MPIGSETMTPALHDARRYYAWIISRFTDVIGHRVLDVGGGFGSHLEHVVGDGREVTSLELSRDCVEYMRRRFNGKAFDAFQGDVNDPALINRFISDRFDTILCINVLEHIADDVGVLRSMAQILAPVNGAVCLFVPAHQALFGTPDVLAGHFRRYSKATLGRALNKAGFTVVRIEYFNSFGAVPYFINSRVLRPKTLGAPSMQAQVVLFDRYLVPILRGVESVCHLPFGQSLVAIARPVPRDRIDVR